jgi:hypothetical protein
VGVHNVFHVSQLKKCLEPQTDVVVEDTIVLEPDLTNKAYPIKVLEQDRVNQNKTTRFYKVQWNNLLEDEATWEREDYLRPIFRTFYPRSWMYQSGDVLAHFKWVSVYLEAAAQHTSSEKEEAIYYHCKVCNNNVMYRYKDREIICEHLVWSGFMDNYFIWSKHVETQPRIESIIDECRSCV